MDDLLGGIDPGAEAADHLAVDGHPAVADHVLAGPAAGDARLGEDLLQPDAVGDLGGVALVDVVTVVEVGVPLGLAGGLEPVVRDRAGPQRGLRLRSAAGGAAGGGATLAVRPGAVTADRLDVVPAAGPAEAGAGTTGGRATATTVGTGPATRAVPVRTETTLRTTAVVTTRGIGPEIAPRTATVLTARSVGAVAALGALGGPAVPAPRTVAGPAERRTAAIIATRPVGPVTATIVPARAVGPVTALRTTRGPAPVRAARTITLSTETTTIVTARTVSAETALRTATVVPARTVGPETALRTTRGPAPVRAARTITLSTETTTIVTTRTVSTVTALRTTTVVTARTVGPETTRGPAGRAARTVALGAETTAVVTTRTVRTVTALRTTTGAP
ncbi:hypothetical protein GCM10009525_39420 [Streptosporangium amethystogenes subsp. fukuiense]